MAAYTRSEVACLIWSEQQIKQLIDAEVEFGKNWKRI